MKTGITVKSCAQNCSGVASIISASKRADNFSERIRQNIFMSNSISSDSLHHLLGIPLDTPLSIDEMCRRLKPVIYPAPELSPRLERFCQALAADNASLWE